mmetsp:Transcript_109650/g.266590  ORF Transcript_109650/g.266590 Transcript_109650/m.266590 type:complete len:318 (+) Transcript_109650:949-1902(+)
MVLLRELLLAQLVQRGHLLGKNAGPLETLREEHDLTNLQEIGHNHGHGAEQRLQVIGQLSTAGVAGVHGDEDAHTRVDLDLLAEANIHGLLLVVERVLDGTKLGRHHGEHLDVDAVELVEAAPRACLTQSLEDLSHSLEIHLRRTVEHVHDVGDSAAQILHSFRLARTSRPSWGSAKKQAKCQSQGDVAAIRQRGNNQPAGVANPFVAVDTLVVSDSDVDVLRLTTPVESQLLAPLERQRVVCLEVDQLLHSITVVHIERDQSNDLAAQWLRQVALHQVNQRVQPCGANPKVLLDSVLHAALEFLERSRGLLRPVDQ